MKKFNKVAQSILGEAQIDPKLGTVYKQISDILFKKGIKAFEQNEIMEAVQKAIKMAFNEGYKAAEQNPFK